MSDLFLLKNSEVLDLFEIKINDYEGYFRFHGSKNFNKDIVFQGYSYIYIPSEISNLEYTSQSQQNRPTLTIANINNFITNFIKDRNDLLGKRFFRKKILARDLDAINFGGENKNPLGQSSFTSYIASDTFVINKKNYESKEKVEFTLANILDIENITIPARKVYNDFCSWQYRGCGCNYGKINGYKGPIVQSNKTNYLNLQQINEEDPNNNLTSYLRVWLRPEGIQTSGDITMKRLGPGPEEFLKFQRVTAWTNEGTSSSPAVVQPDFLSTSPKKIIGTANQENYYSNAGRMNNQSGVYFSHNLSTNIFDKLKINENFSSSEATIFYVAEMTNLLYRKGTEGGFYGWGQGGVTRRGLTSDVTNAWIGWEVRNSGASEKRQDVCLINNFLMFGNNADAHQHLNVPRIYTLTCSTSTSLPTIWMKNGNIIAKTFAYTGGGPGNLVLNINSAGASEIIIYEIIVYNKVLDEQSIAKINSYLSTKYNIMIPKQIRRIENKFSSSYFSTSDGNLGVPVADENNKIFLKDTSQEAESYTNYESYNLLSMEYKSGYNPDYNYKQGDFVKIDANIDYDFNEKSVLQNNEFPSRFFVCVDPNGSLNQHPLNYTDVWKEDKCSRNLNGCLIRFNDPSVNIPFGGFPGTVGYDYKLPGGS